MEEVEASCPLEASLIVMVASTAVADDRGPMRRRSGQICSQFCSQVRSQEHHLRFRWKTVSDVKRNDIRREACAGSAIDPTRINNAFASTDYPVAYPPSNFVFCTNGSGLLAF